MPRCFSSSPRTMTKGVFPVPPTDMLPTLTTGRASLRMEKIPRSYSAFLMATPTPKMAEAGFTGRLAFVPAEDQAHPACGGLLQHGAQINLSHGRPGACAPLADSAMPPVEDQRFPQ